MTSTPSSETFLTFETAEDILEMSKERMTPEMASSLDALNTYQNVLVIWLQVQLNQMAEQLDSYETRFLAQAAEGLWDHLYQVNEDSEEEMNRKDNLQNLFIEIANGSDNVWVTLSFTLALTRYSFEVGAYLAGQAAEKGNSTALEHLSTHKANISRLEDIAQGVAAELAR